MYEGNLPANHQDHVFMLKHDKLEKKDDQHICSLQVYKRMFLTGSVISNIASVNTLCLCIHKRNKKAEYICQNWFIK